MNANLMMKSTNVEFRAIMSRRSTLQGVTLSRILKNGKPGKPAFYRFYGSEKSAEDVISRLEKNNPGDKWIEA